MKKTWSKIVSLMLVFAMVLGMNLNVSAATNTTIAVPTETVDFDAADTVGVVKVTAGAETVTAGFYADDNTDDVFIRAMLPETVSVDNLENATVEVTLADSVASFEAAGIDFTGSGSVKTSGAVDLFNKSYTLTIDDVDYILAAGITGGSQDIPSTELNTLKSVTVGGKSTTLSRNIVQSEFMGNPYFSADPENVLEWTSVNYYVAADMGMARPDSLTATYTKADGTTESKALDMTTSVPSITVDGKTYHFKLAFTGEIEVKYSIDFQEFEKTRALSNASDYASESEWNAAVEKKKDIADKWEDYFETLGTVESKMGNTVTATIYVPSGTTVMSQMVNFLNAEYPGEDSKNTDTYIASIHGLGEFTIGSMSGWMYLEGPWTATCKVPMVGAADYQMTTDGATITWFYVTDYMNHF